MHGVLSHVSLNTIHFDAYVEYVSFALVRKGMHSDKISRRVPSLSEATPSGDTAATDQCDLRQVILMLTRCRN